MPGIIDLTKNPKQREFVFHPARKLAYAGAIRSGKTIGGCARVQLLCDMMPGSDILVARQTYVQLFDTTAKEFLALVAKRNGGTLAPGPYVEHWSQSPTGPDAYTLTVRTYDPKNPSKVRFRYCDNRDMILGQEYSGIWVDQVEGVDGELIDDLEGRASYWNPIRQAEFVTRYGYQPKTCIFYTMNPDPGFAYDRFKVDSIGQYHLIETRITDNAAYLPEDYLKDLEGKPEAWRRRYLEGSWDIRGGQIYYSFDESVHVCDPFVIPDHWPRWIGMDWGHNHPTAVYWLTAGDDGTKYFYRELFVSGKLASWIAQQIVAMSGKEPVARFGNSILVYQPADMHKHDGIVDRTVSEEFGLYGIAGVKANQSVEAGILHGQELLQPGPNGKPRMQIFRGYCPALVRGMKVYSRDEATGQPVKKDDDAVDAARYTWMAALEARSGGPKKSQDVLDNYQRYVIASVLEAQSHGSTGVITLDE